MAKKQSGPSKRSALCASDLTSGMLGKSIVDINLENGHSAEALVDTGSEQNFISEDVVKRNKIKMTRAYSPETVFLACGSSTSKVLGYCVCDITLNGKSYTKVRLKVLKNLVSDVILGIDFMKRHHSVEFVFDGGPDTLCIGDKGRTSTPSIAPTGEQSFCNLTTLQTEPCSLFSNLLPSCKPIASPSRRYSYSDRMFIKETVYKMYDGGIVRPSNSPWRAQLLVVVGENSKRRMVQDYSQTINLFTLPDASTMYSCHV